MATFGHMLSTMQADQTHNTWMAKRYTCGGLSSHDPFYHEYPEVIAMVIERVKYGISVGLGEVEVLPWTALFAPAAGARTVRAQTGKAHAGPLRASFRYMLSGTLIEYSCLAGGNGQPCSLRVRIQLPRLSGTKRFRVGGFEPAQTIAVVQQARATGGTDDAAFGHVQRGLRERSMVASADADGVVEVSAETGPGWALELAPQ